MPWLKFVLSVFLTCCIISSSTSSLYIAIGELYCLLASFCFPTWETQNQTLLLEISIPSWVFNSPPIQHSDWRNWHFTKMFRLRRARNLLTQCIGDTFTFHCYFADKITVHWGRGIASPSPLNRYVIYWVVPCERARPELSEYVWQRGVGSL